MSKSKINLTQRLFSFTCLHVCHHTEARRERFTLAEPPCGDKHRVCCSSLGGGGGGIQRKLAIVLFPPLELFKEHAAPWLHVNAIIILVFLFFPHRSHFDLQCVPQLISLRGERVGSVAERRVWRLFSLSRSSSRRRPIPKRIREEI